MDLANLRTEVIHPLSVHFPLVLLLIASVFSWLSLFKPRAGSFNQGLGWSLLLGCLFAWVAVYTGDLADGRVSRHLCDPTVLKQHENFGLIISYSYSAMLLLYGLQRFTALARNRYLALLQALLGLSGAIMLVYVGHLGASLVYEQAAAVQVPSADCAGF